MLFNGSPASASRNEMLKTFVVLSGIARKSCTFRPTLPPSLPPA